MPVNSRDHPQAYATTMGNEETLIAGAFKVTWKAVTSIRLASTALKKALPNIAARLMKQSTTS